jgi:tRNA (guanine37-N1)-methyltransferase
MSALRVDVLTLFPGLLDGFLNESILKRAIDRGFVEVHRWNIRNWAEGKHHQVDDRPFGGGPGMVLMAPPVVSAVEAVQAMGERPGRLIAHSPQGRPPQGAFRRRQGHRRRSRRRQGREARRQDRRQACQGRRQGHRQGRQGRSLDAGRVK